MGLNLNAQAGRDLEVLVGLFALPGFPMFPMVSSQQLQWFCGGSNRAICKIHWQIWRNTPQQIPIRFAIHHSSFFKGHSRKSHRIHVWYIYHIFTITSSMDPMGPMSDKSGQVMEAPKGLWHPNHLQPSSWYHSHKLAVGAWHPILTKGYLRQMTEFHIMKPPKFRGCFKTKWLKPPPGMFFMQGMARNQTLSPYTWSSQPFGLSGSCHLGFDFAMAAAMCKETLQGTCFFRTKIGMRTFGLFFHNLRIP